MTHQHPPPARFPRRPVDVGTFSPEYTPAELRLIHYVNAVVRASDNPGDELCEAAERLAIDGGFWRTKAELDERITPPAPQPLAPDTKPPAGPAPCKGTASPDNCVTSDEAAICACGG